MSNSLRAANVETVRPRYVTLPPTNPCQFAQSGNRYSVSTMKLSFGVLGKAAPCTSTEPEEARGPNVAKLLSTLVATYVPPSVKYQSEIGRIVMSASAPVALDLARSPGPADCQRNRRRCRR